MKEELSEDEEAGVLFPEVALGDDEMTESDVEGERVGLGESEGATGVDDGASKAELEPSIRSSTGKYSWTHTRPEDETAVLFWSEPEELELGINQPGSLSRHRSNGTYSPVEAMLGLGSDEALCNRCQDQGGG